MTKRALSPSCWRLVGARCTWFYQPVDVAWLAAFRILFGTVMCISMLRFLMYGWIDSFFVNPRFHFTYWGFGWVAPLPGPYMHALFGLLAVCAAAMAAGLYFRLATAVFAVGFGYIQLIDVTNYLNHYYLAWLLAMLLGVSPAARYWSLDAWRTRQTTAVVPFIWSFLFRFQVGVVYTFAGIAKAHGDWLLHGQPLSIWLGANTDLPGLGAVFQWPYVPLLMSWAGFLFDSFIIWFLLWRRTRAWAYAAVLLFHTMTRTLFPIGMFSMIMVLAALVFFPHDWPRLLVSRAARLWRRGWSLAQGATMVPPFAVSSAGATEAPPGFAAQAELGRRERWGSATRGGVVLAQGEKGGAASGGQAAQRRRTRPDRWGKARAAEADAVAVGRESFGVRDKAEQLGGWSWRRNLGIVLVAGYCTLHLLMPLRFLAYGDNVRWHEQGMRFSWRVMVREKNGSVTYKVTDVRSGRTFEVAPRVYLTQRQEREMSGQPDLILQLAHRIRDDYQARLGRAVEVRAEALVSLNGRRMAPLIDPEVDLAQVRDGIFPFHWVLPAPTSAPPRIRPI